MTKQRIKIDNNKHPMFFISKISGKCYTLGKNKTGYNQFLDELKAHNLTLEQYCDMYLENKAHKRHNRALLDNEEYLYKTIKLTKGYYIKIIINKKFTCTLCGFKAVRYESFVSHLVIKHNINIIQYLQQNGFTDKTEYKKCALCDNECYFSRVDWNEHEKTFTKKYDGEVCKTEECKNKTCLKYFGKLYKDAKQQYEHLGGKTEYLCEIYHTDPEGLKKLGHSKAVKNHKRLSITSLQGFISRHGIELGTQLYKDRCNKISKSMHVDWYINKYGKEEGEKRYKERISKTLGSYEKHNSQTISKAQRQLFKELNDNQMYILNYPTISGTVDIYDIKNNVVIEYYGDFWHANPQKYDKDFFHPLIKLTAKEIWNKNAKRIDNIKHELKCNVIIIWESSYFTIDHNIILNRIYNFSKIKNKGLTLWI